MRPSLTSGEEGTLQVFTRAIFSKFPSTLQIVSVVLWICCAQQGEEWPEIKIFEINFRVHMPLFKTATLKCYSYKMPIVTIQAILACLLIQVY